MKLLRDVLTVADFFFAEELPPYETSELIPKKGDPALALAVLKQAAQTLAAADFSHDGLEAALRSAAQTLGIKAGQMFEPVRVAVCGRKTAPPLFGTLEVLGRDTCLRRIDQAIAKLKGIMNPTTGPTLNFVRDIILEDLKTNKYGGRVHTRFPPEPNGYLHIGHAKSICLNFGLAAEFGGKTNLRFDDTNPCKEETEYVDSIIDNVRWLGFDWEDRLLLRLRLFRSVVRVGRPAHQSRQGLRLRSDRRRSPPASRHPHRARARKALTATARWKRTSICSSACAPASFPMAPAPCAPRSTWRRANLNMRDPVMYRILHADHHRTGDKWCIYPMYDYAHGQSDSIERITHSICTLEFEDHRPLYDWYVEQLGIYHPQQIEFDRLNLTYTLLSKRKLLTLVQDGHVSGWDDPRMPTLSGIRRRGYTPEAIRNFCGAVGVSKTNGITELALLEHYVREDLNKRAPRVMAVLRPLRVVIDNYPRGPVEEMEAVNNPEDAAMGTRKVPFSRVLYIEQDDFREDPPKQYFRLSPGREVRLRYGYFITCTGVVKDEKRAKLWKCIAPTIPPRAAATRPTAAK